MIAKAIKIPELVLFLLILFLSACNYEHCKTDSRYAEQPGICGKIYRMEMAKRRTDQAYLAAVYVFVAVTAGPILFVMLFRFVRLLMRIFIYTAQSYFRRE